MLSLFTGQYGRDQGDQHWPVREEIRVGHKNVVNKLLVERDKKIAAATYKIRLHKIICERL